ncbi:MAG: MBL fold metallo-hydrolase [Thermoguttaceae bacterium]|nr:MBL fold metallo-hydrolase [Thermoguttaceae bacterium]MDW8036517.1 MBL fold metallo-hydrolase [Thermoguttaceae bacterium]
MRVVLLGTGGYHPNDLRQTACIMLPEVGILLDAGTGLYRARKYLQTEYLDIFLTHAHLDHIVGLTYLLEIEHFHRLHRITVYGDHQTLLAVEDHLFAEPVFPKRPGIHFQPLGPETPIAGGGQVRHFPLDHPGGCLGYRLDWPARSVAYVTDTVARPQSAYLRHLVGVDLLLHECYFPDTYAELAEKTGHSYTSAVADLARLANVGRLVLVHLNPASEEKDPVHLGTAQSIFPATQLGEDYLEIDF